ncbi:hypothetical protein JCM19238_3761 [Vibrio ponticus]|nr:hypothetical protein JCM19238_3761 [Vibrio ponticus]
MIQHKGYLLDSRDWFLANVNGAIKNNPMAKDNVIQTFSW